MILDRVTVTGADDSVSPEDLVALSKEFPFVEWGILFAGAMSAGQPRWPSNPWIDRIVSEKQMMPSLRLSAHLCGRWVSDIFRGVPSWWETYGNRITRAFGRVQVNTHSQAMQVAAGMAEILERDHEFILQHDGANNETVEYLVSVPSNTNVVALYDTSSGAGRLPGEWGKPLCRYTGYSGGLSPKNVAMQLVAIREVAEDARVWIDVETHVRSDGDSKFDLGKVRAFLETAKPFVTQS